MKYITHVASNMHHIQIRITYEYGLVPNEGENYQH